MRVINLKNLVLKLEELIDQCHSQLDTNVYSELKLNIGLLKEEADAADAANQRRIKQEALKIFSDLLSIVTDITMLLK